MIFVFSGTGNSYSVALRASEALGTGLVDIASSVRYKRYTFDAKGADVGFIFPTYYGGLPSMVLEFARNVVVRNPGRVFCITTCGGESGGACEMLREELGDRLNVDVSYDVLMPDNAVFAFEMPTKEQAEEILKASDAEVSAIIDSLKAGDTGDRCTHKGDGDWRELYRKYDEMRVTEPFTLTDRCIECKICAEICPERVIVFYHRRPVWDEEKCSMCMGCIQMCPKRAIEYGESTVGRGRYWNPAYYEKTLGIKLQYE